jgi:hypothetical protein
MRLVELQPSARALPADLTVAAGDVLRFAASGGHVRQGAAVELLGTFFTAALATDGRVLAPAGAPNAVLFRASRPGQAFIDVVYGDPYGATATATMTVTVDPSGTGTAVTPM